MSVETVSTITCDGCGSKIIGKTDPTTSRGNGSYFDCKDQMKSKGWVQSLTYGRSKHFCKTCADKPQ